MSEREINLQHKDEHWRGPTYYWSECDRCADEIEKDIHVGKRCIHGEWVPWRGDNLDGTGPIATDVECLECQIDYGPAVYAFDGTWQRIQEHELKDDEWLKYVFQSQEKSA